MDFRQRRDPEPRTNPVEEGERKEARPKAKTSPKPLQEQQLQQNKDQQQVETGKEEDDAKENNAGEKGEEENGGKGPANEPKGRKVQNKPVNSERPSNGDRPQHGNRNQYGGSLHSTCSKTAYDEKCREWLNISTGPRRRQNNNSHRNYGTNSSNSQTNQKQRHNGYRQWENSAVQKSNYRNNHYNHYNNYHANNFHQNDNNYMHSVRHINSPRGQGPEVIPQGPERSPQTLNGGFQYPQSLIPLFPALNASNAIFTLQQFSSEMEIPSDYEPACLRDESIWEELSVAIWKKILKCQQRRQVLYDKIAAWGSLFNSMQQIYHDCTLTAPEKSTDMSTIPGAFGLYLVGSTYTGFGLDSSDVDTCIMITNHEIDTCYPQAINFLLRLKENLVALKANSGLLLDCKTLNLIFAKVPVLKFTDVHWKVQFDLNCNNSVGIRNTHLLFHYCQVEWRVQPLVILVKVWAKFHGINDAKEMTLSSYSLTLMVIHYLQCGARPAVLPCLQKMSNKFNLDQPLNVLSALNFPYERQLIKSFSSSNNRTLGELLVGFFEYYSTFNFTRDAISVRLGATVPADSCRFAKAPKNDPSQWKFISIEEPFEQTNTARAVFDMSKFHYILEVFRQSAKNLAQTKKLESIFERIVPASQAINAPIQANLAVNNHLDKKVVGHVPPPFRK